MKKTKLFSYLAVAGFSLAGLVACGQTNGVEPGPGPNPDEGKTFNLVISGPGDEMETNKRLLDDFIAERKAMGDPNTYVFEQVDHGVDKVDSEVIDWKTGPDVYQFASDKIQELFKKGAMAKLGGQYATFVEENNSKTGVEAATFNGSLYAFPYTGDNTYYLQYDKSIFTEEDVKSVEGILAKCAEKNVRFSYPLPTGFYSMGLMFTFGADYNVETTEDGQIKSITADFDGENGIKAGKAMYKIITDKAYVETYTVAGTEDVAIAVNGTWDIGAAQTNLGENYACAPMPTVTVDGDTKSLGCFIGAKLYGVNPQASGADTDRLTAAFEVAKYLSDAHAQEVRFDERNTAPSNTTVAAMDKVQQNENIAVLSKQNEWGHAQGLVPSKAWEAPQILAQNIKEGIATLDNMAEQVKILNDSIINS